MLLIQAIAVATGTVVGSTDVSQFVTPAWNEYVQYGILGITSFSAIVLCGFLIWLLLKKNVNCVACISEQVKRSDERVDKLTEQNRQDMKSIVDDLHELQKNYIDAISKMTTFQEALIQFLRGKMKGDE